MKIRKLNGLARDLTGCPFATEACLSGAERLVGLGFRYWMLGNQRGDLQHFERAWSLFSGEFGVAGGRVALDGLAGWVRSVGHASSRPIRVATPASLRLCADERLAVSMIAACQHRTCPALRACAFALVEHSAIDHVVDHAQGFADTLLSLDQILPHTSIVAAPVGTTANRLLA